MQVLTTTKTTEIVEALGVNFKVTTFEQTTTAFCDCCDAVATGTESQLENAGWFLGSREEFCPNCNE